MKKLLLIYFIVLLLSSCTSLRKQAGYLKGTPINTDWKIIMSTDFKVGDKVIYYRTPDKDDWATVGKIDHQLEIGNECEITAISNSKNKCIFILKGSYSRGWLPKDSIKEVKPLIIPVKKI